MVHVYVIHLKERTDRKEQFLGATKALQTHATIHWFPAINGSTLSDTQLATYPMKGKTRKAKAGRVGCYCSHVAALEQAVAKNHFPLLILEDDALPATQAAAAPLQDLFASAPETATLLYFGALPVRKRRTVKNYCNKAIGWNPIKSDTQLYGGHAYGFRTKAAAEEMVVFLKANRVTFDSALVRYQKKHRDRVAVLCPFQFYQAAGMSNIEGVYRSFRLV
jgi:GR25 family glycosyltransferase involved in LPS biosynthesis